MFPYEALDCKTHTSYSASVNKWILFRDEGAFRKWISRACFRKTAPHFGGGPPKWGLLPRRFYSLYPPNRIKSAPGYFSKNNSLQSIFGQSFPFFESRDC